MRTNSLAWAAGLALALSVLGLGCPGQPSGGPPTGIVLITVDGLVPADISVYGGPIATPSLERMVRDGRAWNDVWTAAPMSRPAAATYMTGTAPDRHGILDDLHDGLAADTETLGSLFTAAGYRTAAFSESSAIGPTSRLADGFEIVDPPPLKQEMLRRLTPRLKPIRETSRNFARWLDSVPPDTKYFAWVHLSRPLRAQMFDESELALEAMQAFDTDVNSILDAVVKRAGEESAVFVAGTFGRVGTVAGQVYGMGTSMAEPAIRVPLIVRAQGTDTWRDSGASIWAPDVSATVAAVAGLKLANGEGVPLQQAPAQRTIFSMSRAPLDQLGWRPIAAARQGSVRVAREGGVSAVDLAAPGSDPDGATVAKLEESLDRRPVPLGSRIPLERIGEALSKAGVDPNPVPDAGREFAAGERRVRALAALWASRRLNGFDDVPAALTEVQKVLAIDPQAAQPLVDRGLFELFGGAEVPGRAKVRQAAALYPTHPEVLRWLALSIWSNDVATGERILTELRGVRPADPDLLYDLACARTLAGDFDGAEEKLRGAIEAGFREFDLMQIDEDLRALRESGRLAAVLREYR